MLNTIFNEDCMLTMARMEDKSVDITFTSPPYNRKRNDKYEHYEDTIDDFYEFLCLTTREMLRVTKRNVFVNIQKNYYNKEEVFRYIGEFSKEICEIIIWEKSNPLPASGSSITNAWEFVLVFGEPLKSNSTYTKNHILTSVNQETNAIHKAMMNIQVSDWFMEMFAHEGDIVYDPFSGFGTTAVSALKFDCNYLGSEISTEYWELGNNRIQESLESISGDKLDSFIEW